MYADNTIPYPFASWSVWFGSFPAVHLGVLVFLCPFRLVGKMRRRDKIEMTASQKTENFQRWRRIIGIPEPRRPTMTWPCQGACQSKKPIAHFQFWRKKTGHAEPTKYARCDACIEAQMKDIVNMFCHSALHPRP